MSAILWHARVPCHKFSVLNAVWLRVSTTVSHKLTCACFAVWRASAHHSRPHIRHQQRDPSARGSVHSSVVRLADVRVLHRRVGPIFAGKLFALFTICLRRSQACAGAFSGALEHAAGESVETLPVALRRARDLESASRRAQKRIRGSTAAALHPLPIHFKSITAAWA